MKKFICFLVSFILMVCSGCDIPKKAYVSLNDVIKTANENRNQSKEAPDIQKYLYKYDDKDEGFTDAEVDMLTNFDFNTANKSYDGSKILTKDMALSDINYLFKLLKYTYGGYEYFGGDKAFIAAKDKIINEINNSDSISVDQMLILIHQSFDFVKDSHFRIHDYAPMDVYKNVYYYSEEYEFYKDKDGYYIPINNRKYYLNSVENSDKVEEYMRLTINSEGKLVYNIGLLQKKFGVRSKLNIKLLNGKKEINKEVALIKSKPLDRSNEVGFSKQLLNGVPYVTCTRMYDKDDMDNTCKLLESQEKNLEIILSV